MKVLSIIDGYPPLDRGGYAQLCSDLAQEIRQQGHSVTVLCAGPGLREPEAEPVIRRLRVPVRWEDRWPVPFQQAVLASTRSRHNLTVLRQVLAATQPDCVLLWPTEYVDRRVMAAAEHLPNIATAYYVAGVSPTDPSIVEQYWQYPGHSALVRAAKALLRPLLAGEPGHAGQLPLKHVMCVSEHERRRVVTAGVPDVNTVVVHNGIDCTLFRFLGLPSVRQRPHAVLRVLYAGRVVEDKGVHIVVEAVRLLRRGHPDLPITVTLLGAGPRKYMQQIDQSIRDHDLSDYVTRRDWIERSEVPAIMAAYDVLVLPALRPEPLARAVQEAMAVGLVVVATPTGGTPEIVLDGVTGLIFPPGDAAALANCLVRLYYSPALCDRLAAQALHLVTRRFTIQAMAGAVLANFGLWMDKRT